MAVFSNYMGSFTGLIIPLFVMAMYSKKAFYGVLLMVFDLLSVFRAPGSSARSRSPLQPRSWSVS